MNGTGSPLSVIDSAGSWRPDAVKGYIDLAANVEANVRQLFRVDFDSESDKEVLPYLWVYGLNPIDRPGSASFPMGFGGVSQYISAGPRLSLLAQVNSRSELTG